MPTIGQLVVELVANTAKFRTDLQQVNQSLDDLGRKASSTQQIFNIFSGISLAHVGEELAQLAVEAVKMAVASQQAEFAFKSMAQAVGADITGLTAALEKASGSTIDFSNIARDAAKGLEENLKPQQLVNLMDVARQRSILMGTSTEEAFNLITEAVTNANGRMLRHAGLVIDTQRAIEDHARALGVDADMLNETGRAQAIYDAVIQKSREYTVDLTNEVVRHKEELEKTHARAKEIWTSIGAIIVDAFYRATNAIADFRNKLGESGLFPSISGLGPRGTEAPETLGAAGAARLGGAVAVPSAAAALSGGLGPESASVADQINQQRLTRLQALAAAHIDLARTLGALTVADKAYQLTTTDALKIQEHQLELLGQETAARLKANAVEQANEQSLTARAAAAAAAEKIRSDALAKTLELQKQIAELQYQQ